MRKIILSFITFVGLFSFSIGFEGNIKVGYDFFRGTTLIRKKFYQQKETSFIRKTRGFVVGVEILPLTYMNGKIKLGVGAEYNFGEKSVYFSDINEFKYTKYYIMLPLYATAKFTYYRPKSIDLNLYTFARIGYSFGKYGGFPLHTNFLSNQIIDIPRNAGMEDPGAWYNNSGFYYGLGLGIDYKYFLAEILYDGRYKRVSDEKFEHKVGIRLGTQLGTQHFNKCIKCEPKIVEKIVEIPKVVKKNTTNEIIIKNFDISAEALFGFNKYELQDLKENGKKELEKKVKELQKSVFEITGINVIGHTDRLGKDEYNYRLGLNRAETIKEYLKELGIKVEIKSSSKGKTQPKVHCNNVKSTSKLKECLQPNRRVELQFIGFETEKKVEEVVETGN